MSYQATNDTAWLRISDPAFPETTSCLLDEARRQLEICNACRYCEGFCSVFPAMTRSNAFASGDISHLANLCHNCRGCYYSCQYVAPHEFALNIPAALGEVRQDSWERHVWPAPLARAFHKRGVAIIAALGLGIALIFWAMRALGPQDGEGFYAYMSHNTMIAIFVPAFLLPFVGLAIGLRRYWSETGGRRITFAHLRGAFASAAKLKNLAGGQGQGCNFEKEDRYTNARRHAHQATMYGFLLCFAATSVATLMHYILDVPAPYPIWSPPKLLGVSGGILLTLGTVALALLKLRSDPELGPKRVWGGEMAFVILLFLIAMTGLVLYAASGTAAVSPLLVLHLGSVFAFFILLPWTKMAHAFFRLAALIIEEQKTR
ncbi:MAG: tricarballylate utilization 4Fe-4S protein TcuB [Mesorhizobium sp.]|uniref:tricarballylate utilization 4Fe-4S protein TcuB n=1 Tax=Mesorhizobium sp. TaxID=1871066 RepID=UPI001AC94922|nr:tricarballylate utilization 4Fe-4S protein TcuB [Mesorhizobium sp.]MBN9221963.1 tricarballylate utilization 4Fe-4S protein TcuB [Mesorhizobium sp.]